ncbi:GET complex (ER membrane insertion) subunit Get1 [Schizosaccharomyces osmophilus]|uniref:GET complex (ER membrane insertion) subunit Get1 n=1 Tax=Schizosaccharomyces osmophilus TaxID=2545709 RepID=A0AAF0AXH9_9SCHI|nr:GET complex (ER membrane insertion) subunit Get1 [Schizosaccharomyces osmophilus]WBW73849.1 GET complex (ER membrane insertion) subunit Get1 [Schizosaccharomyces osmophilus]
MDLIVATILLSLLIHFFDKYFKEKAINGIYQVYLACSKNEELKKNKDIFKELLSLKKELNRTSSQDEFAKWARLNRKYEKLNQELENQSTVVQRFQETFKKFVSIVLWILTRGFRFYMQYKKSKAPVFFLPAFLLPPWALWFLSLPRSKYGSVSLTVWNYAVGKTISSFL